MNISAIASDNFGIDQVFEDAVAAYRAGKFAEVEALCQGILKRQPDHIGSLQVLGAVAANKGAPRRGIELLEKVVAQQPRLEAHRQSPDPLRLRNHPAAGRPKRGSRPPA